MVALDLSVHANWLLESQETMPENERNVVATPAELRAGKALGKAIKSIWKPRSQRELAAVAGIDPSTLSGLKTAGFDSDNNSALKVANALRIDFRLLCDGKVEPTTVPVLPASSLSEMVRTFEGTPDEPFIREVLSRLRR